ncbi:patatin-like phospholipase family protein [Azospirillum canadense]|uniref:patatin-like phospholipase family protein n=1 Tax=Azospirillum canadense TaxID=403962 RepID=UPI003873BCFE
MAVTLCGPSGTRSDTDLVALALSGGGLKATAFASEVMFQLQDRGVLPSVDVISSVSGGSLAAALYAYSVDGPDDAPCARAAPANGPVPLVWRRTCVHERIATITTGQALGALRPDRLAAFLTTSYDRSDFGAELLARDLFGAAPDREKGAVMADLNPARPTLIINATQTARLLPSNRALWWPTDGASRIACMDIDPAGHVRQYGLENALNFGFTREQFDCLGSDLGRYPLAYAAMASAAIPGLLANVTLRDFRAGEPPRFRQLMDGGTGDNLGLTGLRTAFHSLAPENGHPFVLPDRILVLQVHAGVGVDGYEPEDAETRHFLDHILLNGNALKAIDTFMFAGYEPREEQFDQRLCALTTQARAMLRDRIQRELGDRSRGDPRGYRARQAWIGTVAAGIPAGKPIAPERLMRFLAKLSLHDVPCTDITTERLMAVGASYATAARTLSSGRPVKGAFEPADIDAVPLLARLVPAHKREKIALVKALACDESDWGPPAAAGASPTTLDLCRAYSGNGKLLPRIAKLGSLLSAIPGEKDLQCVRYAAKLATFLSFRKMCATDEFRLAFGDLLQCGSDRDAALADELERDDCLSDNAVATALAPAMRP